MSDWVCYVWYETTDDRRCYTHIGVQVEIGNYSYYTWKVDDE